MKTLYKTIGITALLLFAGCGSGGESSSQDTASSSSDIAASSSSAAAESANAQLFLEENGITCDDESVQIEGAVATITRSGTYRISGTLEDGRIIVDSDDDGTVILILDNVTLYSSTNAPIAIMNAGAAEILLEDGSYNTLTDASVYVFDGDDDEPNAALFSKDDLSIGGNGTLRLNANYNDGITSKDTLTIRGGTFVVFAADDGIRGKDALTIQAGTFTMNTYGDVLKSDDDEAGVITVTGGTFNLVSYEGDVMSAESNLSIASGTFNLHTAEGYTTYMNDDSNSMKCLKAGTNLLIEGGTFNLNCADDALHSNDTLTVENGTFTIATGDDALHSDIALTINDGNITIEHSYEGIESGIITLNGGRMSIVSDDDGINAASDEVSTRLLTVNGGVIVVESEGDGIDVNGAMVMNGGLVLVHGPVSENDSALDYDMQFRLNGGTLIAVGSSRMAQAPSQDSAQNAVSVTFDKQQSAGTLINLQKTDGTSLMTFEPKKPYQSLVYASPLLMQGDTYSLYLGGSVTGTSEGGYYAVGTYTPGTLYRDITLTTVGK